MHFAMEFFKKCAKTFIFDVQSFVTNLSDWGKFLTIRKINLIDLFLLLCLSLFFTTEGAERLIEYWLNQDCNCKCNTVTHKTMNWWCYNFQYLYNCAFEKQISRKLLHRRMYAITDPNIFPVKPLSWFNFFSNTSIKNSLIFLQLKQNLVAFRTPSLPSLPLIANILSTSIIFFALSMTSSHITWKNWAWVLHMKNEMTTRSKVSN